MCICEKFNIKRSGSQGKPTATIYIYIYIMCSRVFAGTDLGVVVSKPPKLKLKSFIYLLFLTKTLVNIKGQNSLVTAASSQKKSGEREELAVTWLEQK